MVYDNRGRNSPRWWPSRYGAEDEIGASNELSPRLTLEALRLPQTGEILELAQVLAPGTPTWPPRTFHQLIDTHSALLPFGEGTTDATVFEESVAQGYHVGCHLDGLGHIGIHGHFYNGHHFRDFVDASGLTKFGIERVPPWMTRGVCLDIAALVGVTVLDLGFVIMPSHLEFACERQEVEVRAGDVVLLNTGWGTLWTIDDRYIEGEPGAGIDVCHWLTDRRVSAVGADNAAFEVIPPEAPDLMLAGHQHLLTETGTYIIENLRLDDLAKSGRSEFLFVMATNKVKGATASMVSPLAVL